MKTTIKERLIKYLKYKGIGQNKFEKAVGLSVGYISHITDNIGNGAVMKIINNSPDLNREWLVYGEGEMLKEPPSEQLPAKTEGNIIKYWIDVDSSAGYVDFPTNPNERKYKEVVIPDFNDCTDAVNLYGDSMFPLYKNGEVIILKQWHESFIDFGNVYLIITKNGNRMVKYLRQGSDDAHVLCSSENKNFDSFEILKADIQFLYIVKGSIKKNTL